MPRKAKHAPLNVYLNNRLVGMLSKQPSGAIKFVYDENWLNWEHTFPISLSLPLREDAYRGEAVVAVFENLLPDSDLLRKRVAEKVGARGIDAYSLLKIIGRDCVGALQFMPDEAPPGTDSTTIDGEAVSEQEIEKILNNLTQAPLGLQPDDDFRISVAGAQQKTAFLHHEGRWLKPKGTTPTTHLFKTQIGHLPEGIDLTNSVENEFYCLQLFKAFGLPVNNAQIKIFGNTKALVIERFDRRWTKDGRLIRLPQEDCCQSLSIPPTMKYQNQGGPGIVDILAFLKGSDNPISDQIRFLKAQILFWLIGATDGHAKNFSVFLGAGGGYSLTPFYDILTTQPCLDANQITRRQMKLAMSVGNSRHYRIDQIYARHFIQTSDLAGLPRHVIQEIIEQLIETAPKAISELENTLPDDFPDEIHTSIHRAMSRRLDSLKRPTGM
ncbi:type II toxin-antitoxin system HipA family toxin [Thalassospira indica]|uniref:Type II toxin-antitoxin system HipA family toxin n=1 Tax=Thalassospira indica TaxID=1891279 RepID=A0ABM6XVE8_9PROT|nr:type II toxin-antitoxin system HipA family toxin [Thalassospira indica]AXO13344.1 type II toxin-antitoxin system HipA family toxin [Thalassospira indica]OAZ14780.1 toxin HipA [Thalassospira profundimaris]